ncbi:MAG TPA: L-serine ammonia-lyase [Paraburkholderia sp.]|jgi:L-serine dehydratase|nr:L-serine ammonia-lyase [Paraburkholderia sp.]
MTISVFDLFRIGIGPSSSHTVGPMRAALRFVDALARDGRLDEVARVRVELFGSLGATGKGHGTDRGVLLGLMGEAPDTVEPATIDARIARVHADGTLVLRGCKPIGFVAKRDIAFYRQALPDHPNALTLHAFAEDGAALASRTYLSVGGGFIVEAGAPHARNEAAAARIAPYPFRTAQELFASCDRAGLSVAELMRANERVERGDEEIRSALLRIWAVMHACIERGCASDEAADRPRASLGGPLGLKRRAPELHRALLARTGAAARDPLTVIDWVNLFAIAVNEENAAGGQVVTAPTNGAAGIIPAALQYYVRFVPDASDDGVVDFLLTAGAIGILYKLNASISGAEVGCQGEVGVACSMAAAGLAAVLGGTNAQIENAAEIGMEHNLGLTCDPVGGLVQIPCIERNAMGAVKALNAARMALNGDGTHHVSLDAVIRTMRETGADMKTKYKETSRGGLAVNVAQC